MKVILKADIKGIGKKDEVVNASDGYARNYLFPKNLALEANTENMAKLKTKNDANQYRKDIEKDAAMAIADKFKKIELKVFVKVGENGKVFGGISSKDIADKLDKEYKIKIDKKKIELKETIKSLGTNIVDIKLYEGVVGKLKITVLGE